MMRFKKRLLAFFLALFCAAAAAQTTGFVNGHPRAQHSPARASRRPLSLRDYLASDDGRAWLQVSGNAKSSALNQLYGAPSAAATARAEARLQRLKAQPRQSEPRSASGWKYSRSSTATSSSGGSYGRISDGGHG